MTTLDRLRRELGEFLESHDRGRDLSELGVYRGRPVDFAKEVLGVELWSVQEEIARAAVTDRRLCLVGANSTGKDVACAVLALYAAYVERALVLLTGPTARQVREISMGTIRRLWSRSDLPGEAFVEALRVPGLDEGGILAFVSSEVGRFTGFHAPRVWTILQEGQSLPEHAFEAMFANATGPEDRVVVHGNPLFPVGRFVQLAKSDGWRTFTIPATSHPNIAQGRTVIPGGPSAEWIEHMRDTYGASSNLYRSRVLAEFPSQAEDGLFSVEQLVGAAERWARLKSEHAGEEPVASLDVARLGLDASVLAVRRGPAVVAIKAWRKLTTGALRGVVVAELRQHGIRPSREVHRWERRLDKDGRFSFGRGLVDSMSVPMAATRVGGRGTTIVDEVGLGAGTLDGLREAGYQVVGFAGGRRALAAHRFANLRSEAFWHLRDLLDQGAIAVPQDEDLHTELLAMGWAPDGTGRVAVTQKDELRTRLGRSPDVADAISMLFSTYSPARAAGGARFHVIHR